MNLNKYLKKNIHSRIEFNIYLFSCVKILET